MRLLETSFQVAVERRAERDVEEAGEEMDALTEAIALYRATGYNEIPAFNNELYAHHWFEKRIE